MSAPWYSGWTRARLIELAFTVALLAVVLSSFAHFVQWVETRPGALLADPVLRHVGPRDFTWPVFLALYGALFSALGGLARDPERLLQGAQAYALMVLLRILAMWVTPLDPPLDAIPLQDPIVRLFGPSQVLTRDLFFSGHTATCVIALLATQGRLRIAIALATVGVAAGVLLQHVHYTLDVLAAPLFAFAAFALTRATRTRLGLPAP